MSEWHLDPAGIQAVLLAVDGEASAMNEALDAVDPQAILTGVSSVPDFTGPVRDAVAAAIVSQQTNIAAIISRINAGQLGVLNATLAYRQGNEDMAAATQAAALDAADTGDLSWFEQNGVL